MSSWQHKQDKNGECAKRGREAELELEAIYKRNRFKFRRANEKEQKAHIDHIVETPKGTWKVDVKSEKKWNRSDECIDGSILWVEFSNEFSARIGWLKGQADTIAIQRKNDFVLVPRLELYELSKALVDLKDFTRKPQLYKSYRRYGKKYEHSAPIEMRHVLSLNHSIWKKA